MNIKSWYCQFFLAFFLISSQLAFSQDLAINEVMASNSTAIDDEDGDFSDWIEIYNYGTVAVDLNGYGITDDPTSLFKWVFPAQIIQPGEYILVWASGKDRAIQGQALHTNFKISSSGEPIILTSELGILVDQVAAVELDSDVSYGRQPDGTGSWLFFYASTPATPNIGTGLSELLLAPTFSHESGMYPSSFNLILSHNNPNVSIVYTLDGSEPALNYLSGGTFSYKNVYPTQISGSPGPMLAGSYTSLLYASQISIYDKSAEPEKVASKNTRQHTLYVPVNPVRKGTVVKAKAFVNGIGSVTVSRTYFIWSGGNPYNIPVISLQIQEDYMFDYEDGVYTAGVNFDTWRANNPLNNQYYRPEWNNYWRRGVLWEYPMNIELFETSQNTLTSVMNVNGGFRIHGNNSRARGIKNLRFYARSKYDSNNMFEHDLFDNTIPGATVANNNFKRILLRGDGSGGSIAYDVVFNNVMQPVFNGVARIKPAVHFINGEYWGLTAIRDRFDDRHFALNFGLNSDNIAIVDCKASSCVLDQGISADYSDYTSMRNFIINNDMTDQGLFDQAADRLDMSSFIDHMVLQIYSADDSYEIKYWKARNPENNNYGDGKWRLTVQDFEAALKQNINWMEYRADVLNGPNIAIFGNLLANEGFKIQFVNRFADILNTVFTTEYFNSVVDKIFDEITPYLPEDANRYPKTDFYKPTEKVKLLDWGTTRRAIQQEQIKDFFSFVEVLDFNMNISDANAGFISINSIEIKPSTPGVSQNPYPWLGQYFHNVPVTLKAVALPGYTFSHWSGDVSGTNPVIEVTATSDMQIQANFNAVVSPQEVVYFWLMDKDIPNDTPLENLSAMYASNGLNALLTYNSCLAGYPFTSSHPSWRKASLERKNEPTALNYYPEVNNNVPYANTNMRGVQVRQPFRSGNLEIHLVFDVPTTDLENIRFSLAAKSNGAAETMLIDYWNGTQWTLNNLYNPALTIKESYQVLEFDFSNVAEANNNPDFKIRMRFDGANMTVDNNDEVIMNNIVLAGSKILSTDNLTKSSTIKVYPNPTNNIVNVESSDQLKAIVVYNIYGQEMLKNFPNGSKGLVELESFSPGIYLIKVVSGNAEQTIRVVKQ